ncbi:MAG: hypothetical protein Q8R47_05410 [Nanoarchaeota archaeon]|nr:hypothetical protein [Nanoarchaeota archaeon]
METKNKKKGDALDSLLSTISSQQLLKIILQRLHQEQGLQLPELIQAFQAAKEEASIPLSIFSHTLDPAEALYKFLKENEHFSFREIAAELHRDQKSVWATYQRARKKKKQVFLIEEERYFLPFSIFKKRRYSFLESVVFYLNSVHHLSNRKIAALLQRTPNTVAVLMKRARDKHGSA